MDTEKSRTVYVGYVPGQSGSVTLWPFDQELTQQMFELERKYVHFKLEICSVGNINMYGEYLPVLAEAATLDEFEKLIVEQLGPKRKKPVNEQETEFMNLVEKVANKNSDALAALAEIEKSEMTTFNTVDELFDDLNDGSHSER